MKYLLFVLSFMLPLAGTGQIFEKAFDIIEAYQPDSLEKYLDASIDLTIDDDYDFINKKQASQKIGEFLDSIGNIKLNRKHQGNSKSQNSNYKVADLTSPVGEYRVFIYSEKIGSKHLIKEVRIDKV